MLIRISTFSSPFLISWRCFRRHLKQCWGRDNDERRGRSYFLKDFDWWVTLTFVSRLLSIKAYCTNEGNVMSNNITTLQTKILATMVLCSKEGVCAMPMPVPLPRRWVSVWLLEWKWQIRLWNHKVLLAITKINNGNDDSNDVKSSQVIAKMNFEESALNLWNWTVGPCFLFSIIF